MKNKKIKEYINRGKVIDKINLKELKKLTLKERIRQILVLTRGLGKITADVRYKRNVGREIIDRWNTLKNAYK